jgi:pyruvate dehydrogenase E2 component (dihydrolipoamide acetyltransferase)
VDEGDSLSLFKASGDVDEGPVFRVQRPDGRTPSGPKPERVTGPYGRVLAVPAARRLARELEVDLAQVDGSGPNGRIRVDDVRAQAEGGPSAGAAAPSGRSGATPVAATRYQTPEGYGDREERLPMRGLRRAISNQMVASHLQTVRALHVDEADVSDLVALRSRLKARAQERGVKLSYLPFVMKAVVSALKAFPVVNASYDEERGEIVRKRYYNLGLAVATEQGLVVPVVQDVDRRSLMSIAAEVQRLAEAARAGKLAPEDMRGGTFSITNIGTIGGLFSFPIINVPEAAILGVHSIQKRPVVLEDDRIVPRHMLYLSLSFDHRLVDGAEGARFTSHVIDLLEAPDALMLDL